MKRYACNNLADPFTFRLPDAARWRRLTSAIAIGVTAHGRARAVGSAEGRRARLRPCRVRRSAGTEFDGNV
jgi:hypothetical protein